MNRPPLFLAVPCGIFVLDIGVSSNVIFSLRVVEMRQCGHKGTDLNYTIREITEITGLSADTLRYYEKEGIVLAKRRENGYRFYDENDISVLKYIVVMKYAGFSLAEIKSIAMMFGLEPSDECGQIVKSLLESKIDELGRSIRNYQKVVELMEASLPIVGCADAFRGNEKALDDFIGQIFDDIQKGEFIK